MKQGSGWAIILTPLNVIKNQLIWVQPFERKKRGNYFPLTPVIIWLLL